jgi:hypothetical protein
LRLQKGANNPKRDLSRKLDSQSIGQKKTCYAEYEKASTNILKLFLIASAEHYAEQDKTVDSPLG